MTDPMDTLEKEKKAFEEAQKKLDETKDKITSWKDDSLYMVQELHKEFWGRYEDRKKEYNLNEEQTKEIDKMVNQETIQEMLDYDLADLEAKTQIHNLSDDPIMKLMAMALEHVRDINNTVKDSHEQAKQLQAEIIQGVKLAKFHVENMESAMEAKQEQKIKEIRVETDFLKSRTNKTKQRLATLVMSVEESIKDLDNSLNLLDDYGQSSFAKLYFKKIQEHMAMEYNLLLHAILSVEDVPAGATMHQDTYRERLKSQEDLILVPLKALLAEWKANNKKSSAKARDLSELTSKERKSVQKLVDNFELVKDDLTEYSIRKACEYYKCQPDESEVQIIRDCLNMAGVNRQNIIRDDALATLCNKELPQKITDGLFANGWERLSADILEWLTDVSAMAFVMVGQRYKVYEMLEKFGQATEE